mmetsp:Transcript_24699/g.42350  ORF Transcript_24699/g.42350 Transcript_24699/m.42350 type:complete len:204 (-) Transcript_24699:122-733(-)
MCASPRHTPTPSVRSSQVHLCQLHLHVNTSWQVERHQRVNDLRRGVSHVNEALVGPNLKVLSGILVNVWRAQDAENLLLGRQADRTSGDGLAGTASLHDLLGGGLQQRDLVRLQLHSDAFLGTVISSDIFLKFRHVLEDRSFSWCGFLGDLLGSRTQSNAIHHSLCLGWDQRTHLLNPNTWSGGRDSQKSGSCTKTCHRKQNH